MARNDEAATRYRAGFAGLMRRGGMNRRIVGAAVVAIGLCASSDVAHAQQATSGQQTLRKACAADYRALCSGVQPGGGRIMACFEQNATQLSSGCKQALQAAKAQKQGSGG